MSTRHEAVSCDNCLQTNFEGIRFKCLICFDYDLCERCHTSGATTERHLTSHPMQCILTRSETSMLYSSDGAMDAFTCPHCGQYGFKADELSQHVICEHSSENKTVICPICIVNPAGDPNQMVRDLAQHMTVEHQNQNGRSRRGDTIRELRRMIYPSRGGSGRQPSSNRRNQSRDVPFMTFVQGKYSVGLIISFIHSSSLLLVVKRCHA